ncbi:MAG: hypothetical protein ACI80P_001555 [Flavobacteriales bacterium]
METYDARGNIRRSWEHAALLGTYDARGNTRTPVNNNQHPFIRILEVPLYFYLVALTDNLRKKVGSFYLNKEVQNSRQRKGTTLKEASSIALLYEDLDETHYKQVKSLVKSLHNEHGIQRVCAMGFINEQQKNIPVYQTQKLEYMYFTKRDLTWDMRPKAGMMNFVNEQFDLIIDLSMNPVLPLQFLLKTSLAHMKVGSSLSQSDDHLDFILELEPNASLDEYWRQVMFYLTNLKIK